MPATLVYPVTVANFIRNNMDQVGNMMWMNLEINLQYQKLWPFPYNQHIL